MTLTIGSYASKAVDKPSGLVNSYGADNLKSFVSEGLSPEQQQARFMNEPIRGFAGVSPKQAKELFEQWSGVTLASNSLYLLEITDLNPTASTGNLSEFQLFTTSISYSPVTIPAEKQNIGSAILDGVKSTEAIDLSLTTYDDNQGTLKRWFDAKAAQVANSDGTVGLPADYLVKGRILHSFFSDETNKNGYEVAYLMRPVSIEHSLSRSEGGKQELPMNFTQFDTFMSA